MTTSDGFSTVVNTTFDTLELGDVSVELFDSVWPDLGNSALELNSDDFDLQDVPPVHVRITCPLLYVLLNMLHSLPGTRLHH